MKTFFERENLRYAMIGSGSWATALIKLLLNHQESIGWYLRDEKKIEQVRKTAHNPFYLQSVHLDPDRLHMSTDINEIVSNADVLVFCTPSAYFMRVMSNLNVSLENKFIISAIKGFVAENNLTIAEYFHEFHNIPFDRIGVVSGPCHAEEIALERLSYLTIGCKDLATAQQWRKLFDTPYVRTTPSNDIKGLEYASVMKNIYAIAAGMCSSLRYGDNFQAVLLTNAMHEIMRFTKAQSDIPRDITNSGYLGDVLVTAYSNFSRNRQFGQMIGMGYSVKAAQTEMEMIAEGYYGTKAIHLANKALGVDIPIVEAMYQILYKRKSPKTTIKDLTQKFE